MSTTTGSRSRWAKTPQKPQRRSEDAENQPDFCLVKEKIMKNDGLKPRSPSRIPDRRDEAWEVSPLWIKNGWHEKFNRSPDPADSRTGHSPEQVAALDSPDVKTLLNYYQAVLERSKRSITSLSSSDLSRKIDDPWARYFPTVGSRLIVALAEALRHAGQVCYICGLLKGKGWQDF